MLLGEYLDLPWYRTVFTNLGDVISPETLPPLQLESRPVDVGELIGDTIARAWWSSRSWRRHSVSKSSAVRRRIRSPIRWARSSG